MRWINVVGVAAVTVAASPYAALAGPSQDEQIWTSLTATKSLSKDVLLTMEAHLRFEDDLGGVAQVLLRPSVTYKLSTQVTATLGYLYFRNDPETGRTTNEHRGWQQLGYPLLVSDGLRLVGRTRFEERFQQGSDGTVGWRVRQQLRLEKPLLRPAELKAIVWNETFVGLNDTSWGARSGFDQTRTFVGFGLPIRIGLAVELGYLNQFINRRGQDQVNHIFALNFLLQL